MYLRSLSNMVRTRDHFSAISHLVAAVASIVVLTLLIVFAVLKGTTWHIVGFSIFGAGLILLYTMSCIYHFIHIESNARKIFQRVDHAAIYVLIAGTYTPVCLTVLRGPWGWTMLAIIWTIATIGILVKLLSRMHPVLSTLLYVVMGWLIAIAVIPLSQKLSFAAIVWLFLGGIFYTVGAFLYYLDHKFPYHGWFNLHDAFHILVIFGSVSHMVFMFYLL